MHDGLKMNRFRNEHQDSKNAGTASAGRNYRPIRMRPRALRRNDDALYERHLLFDNGVDPQRATARDRFDALARSVRDVLSQRWLLTEKTYEQQNAKRLYYLSMEFLIGRSLEDNVTNLL